MSEITDLIIKTCIDHYGVDEEKFKQQNSKGVTASCRYLTMKMLYEFENIPFIKAGPLVGITDRGNIFKAKQRVEKMEMEDGAYRFELNKLRHKLSAILQSK